MNVCDARFGERPGESRLVELRIPAGAGKAAHVHERLDAGRCEGLHELLRGTGSVPDRPDAHPAIKRGRGRRLAPDDPGMARGP